MIERIHHLFRSLFRRTRLEREMQDEITEHLDRSIERLMARGMSPEEARSEAMREFGNVAYHQEESRIARGTSWIDDLLADARYARSQFRRNPLSMATMVAVLAFGIGVNAILFTTVYSNAFDPPAGVEAADDLVRIRGSQFAPQGRILRPVAISEVEAYRNLDGVFASVAGWTSLTMAGETDAGAREVVTTTFVTPEYFDVLGVGSILGPGLRAERVDAGADVAVLSHTLWRRWFAEQGDAIGRSITLGGRPLTIVGVMPPEFDGGGEGSPDGAQIWLPLDARRPLLPESSAEDQIFFAVARLQPGVKVDGASAAVAVVAAAVTAGQEWEAEESPASDVVPLRQGNFDFDSDTQFMAVVFTALGLLILMVTCTNVSALQTGLAMARRREIAIRLSLGASRRRIIRQLLTESVILALVAAIASFALGYLLLQLMTRALDFEFAFSVTLAPTLFTTSVALGAGILLGLSPALHATRLAFAEVLKDSASTVAGVRGRLQRTLVVAQIGLTQPLAVVLATFISMGVYSLRTSPPNPAGDRIVEVRLEAVDVAASDPAGIELAEGTRAAAVARVIQRLQTTPAVERVAHRVIASLVPESPFVPEESLVNPVAEAEPVYVNGDATAPGQLEALGYTLNAGRFLTDADTLALRAAPGTPIPAVIPDDMARTLWPGASPLGRRVVRRGEGEPVTLEVVGVFENRVDDEGNALAPFHPKVIHDPAATRSWTQPRIVVRTVGPADNLIPTIRAVVLAEAPEMEIISAQTIASIQRASRTELQQAMMFVLAGGALALFLSALGLYAVVAFAVSQRSREIAVRMAIGGRSRQIVRHFAQEGTRLGGIGIAIGLPISLAGLWAAQAFSTDMPPISIPVVTMAVGSAVLLVAVLASWLPASRAAEVDPAVTLRSE